MKPSLVDLLRCSDCGNGMELATEGVTKEGEKIRSGTIICGTCNRQFHVKDYIPRFVSTDDYCQNFALQWNKHAKTQIDSYSGITLSRRRFYETSGWAQNLKGQTILEAGCGSGRFTEIAVQTGAQVFSFDYTTAVDANLGSIGFRSNLHLLQADIYKIPFPKGYFDKIFCFGVLQHCPDPMKAFLNLTEHLRPGGEIIIDIYQLKLRDFLNPTKWLRILTRRMDPESLYRHVKKLVFKLFPLKMWVRDNMPLGRYFAFLIPIVYHRGTIKETKRLTHEQLVEWSILDTYDCYSAKFDKPQTIRTVRKWFADAGLKAVDVRYGFNGINGKGVKSQG